MQTCPHSPAEIDGELVCIDCGFVIDRVEVQAVDDWKSHNVRLFSNSKISAYAYKICANLNLPMFAFNTLVSVSSKLIEIGITKKKALLYGTVYACRTHKIPRLLPDIYHEIQKVVDRHTKTRRKESEKSILKILNRISKKAFERNLYISPPDKSYYLKAYLAKIQGIIESESSPEYFDTIRTRSEKLIQKLGSEPSASAKYAILCNVSSTFKPKVRDLIN